MFTYERIIFLRETDATGSLYFSELSKLALEAFEAYMMSKGFTLQAMIEQGDFLLPIVHAESDFFVPLRVGDCVKIHLVVETIGTSSFAVQAKFYYSKNEREVGKTKIIHVALSKKTGKSIPIPESILSHLCTLC